MCLGHIGIAVYLSLVDSFSSHDSEEIFDSSMNLTITEKCFCEPKIREMIL